MLTFDSLHFTTDSQGNQLGQRLPFPCRTSDGRTVDSTGAFLVGELERLDLTLHEPLASVSWGRDLPLREDVTIADEISSFTLSTYGSTGGLGTGNVLGNGKAWIGKDTTQISGVSVDIAKVIQPLRPWSLELKFTILELESAAKIGRPIDQQKFAGLQLKHQMDIDEQAYFGDSSTGDTGLVNSSRVTQVAPFPVGALLSTAWATKTPDEILSDFNLALTTTAQTAAWAVIPSKVLLPWNQYGYIATQKVSSAGNVSILTYVLENNLLAKSGGQLDIKPVKWGIGTGVGGTPGVTGTVDRMVVYTMDKERVRYPMTMLQRTPVQYDGIYHKSTYFCRLGVTEVVYPETISYWDGL